VPGRDLSARRCLSCWCRVVGQRGGHGLDSPLEFGQVVVDGGLEHLVAGVEVAVSQVVAHAGDLAPGDGGLGVEQLGGQGSDGLADFQQADPDGVEYQAVGQVTAPEVGADGVDRGLDVSEPLLVR